MSADLIARLEGLSGPCREVEIDIWRMFSAEGAPEDHVPLPWLHCVTESVDDAVELGDRLLPGKLWHLMTAALKAWSIADGKPGDLARFYCIALFRALEAEGARDE